MQASAPSERDEPQYVDIVVIDDDQLTLDLLRGKLRRVGAAVCCFEDCEEALAYLSDYDVPVLLVDHRMPGVSGIEFLEQLHLLGNMPPTVFLASAIELPADVAIAAERLGVHFLSKDYYRDAAGLCALISQHQPSD